MCLARAYLNKWTDEPVLQDIAHMRLLGERVELETLFGEEKVVQGKLVEVDFAASKILLNEHGGQKPEFDSGRFRMPDSR
jgi:predicted RNA-binding protein